MPFTPLHMGPGLLIKSVLQSSFSLMLFGWSQILMDLQPLFSMITGKGDLHGFSHTIIGATLLALLAALSGKQLSEYLLKFVDFTEESYITWKIAIISAFIGTYSHVLLDSIMHSDVTPYFPFSEESPLYFIISIEALHEVCFYSGIVGAIIYFGVIHYQKKRNNG